MAIVLDVYKKRRVATLRFERATTGNPDIRRPDIDERGQTGTEHGPVVGITEGDTIIVRLVRERIDKRAPLFAITTAPAIASVTGAQLPATDEIDLEIKGVAGGNPQVAIIEIRHGSARGPLLHRIAAWVFTRVPISVTPHEVTIAGVGGAAAVGSGMKIDAVKDLVRAIWRPCGIDIRFQPSVPNTPTYAAAGRVTYPSEVQQMVASYNLVDTINAYFVNCLVVPGHPDAVGFGVSKAQAPGMGFAGPAVVIGGQNVSGDSRAGDSMSIASGLAHEIGHFFGLRHPERAERMDLWSRTLLMHNFNITPRLGGWLDEIGYGKVGADLRRGCKITMKKLAQLTTDGECGTARKTIDSVAGPY